MKFGFELISDNIISFDYANTNTKQSNTNINQNKILLVYLIL